MEEQPTNGAQHSVAPEPIPGIPDSVRAGAMGLAKFMRASGFYMWQLDAVADRNVVIAYAGMLRQLGLTHFVHHKATPVDGTFRVFTGTNELIVEHSCAAGHAAYIPFRLPDGEEFVHLDFLPADPDFVDAQRLGPITPVRIE